jgi:hypothetical protein
VVSYPAGSQPAGVRARDLDGDGDSDLAVSNSDVALVSILDNLGDGIFEEPRQAAVGAEPWGLAIADLDGDGGMEIAAVSREKASVSILSSRSLPPFSRDDNTNGVPDECEGARFHRGDADADGSLVLTDALVILLHLFGGAAEPTCLEALDVQNDGTVGLTDAVGLLNFLFRGGPPPASPGSTDQPCGLDPDPPTSPAHLGCARHDACSG